MGLGKGIKGCKMLKKFVLSRSNLDQPRAAALLQGVVENHSVGGRFVSFWEGLGD